MVPRLAETILANIYSKCSVDKYGEEKKKTLYAVCNLSYIAYHTALC